MIIMFLISFMIEQRAILHLPSPTGDSLLSLMKVFVCGVFIFALLYFCLISSTLCMEWWCCWVWRSGKTTTDTRRHLACTPMEVSCIALWVVCVCERVLFSVFLAAVYLEMVYLHLLSHVGVLPSMSSSSTSASSPTASAYFDQDQAEKKRKEEEEDRACGSHNIVLTDKCVMDCSH